MKKQKVEKLVLAPAPRPPMEGPGKSQKAGSKRQTEIPVRKSGRLGRDVQSKIGETLQTIFDDIVKEGVPDRFARLLEQIEVGDGVAPTGDNAEQSTKSGEPGVTGSKVGLPIRDRTSDQPFRKTSDKESS